MKKWILAAAAALAATGLLLTILVYRHYRVSGGTADNGAQPVESTRPSPLVSEALNTWRAGEAYKQIAVTYPRAGAIFPPEFPAPMFSWKPPDNLDAEGYVIAVFGRSSAKNPEDAGGGKLLASGTVAEPAWSPSGSEWETVKKASAAADAEVVVLAYKPDADGRPEILASGKTRLRTSTDHVGAPILYRDVSLPFVYAIKNPDTIRWRLLNTASAETPPVVLENLPVCGNCHSASLNGKILGMDVDYASDKGSYALTPISKRITLDPEHIITWGDFRREDGDDTYGLLAQVSPTGRYSVCTVKDRSVFTPVADEYFSQLFFPIKGILCVYDRIEKKFFALKGADDSDYVQSNPGWSPDEKYVYFARSPDTGLAETDKMKGALITTHLAKEFLDGERGFQYEIWRVPFNEGRGGKPEPVKGASSNGMSNYFPKVSPDGKWLVFCQAENFMLLQPDSALYIVPAGGGLPRRMRCNTKLMNSWHSWSPNSRWLVFSSKANGPYTQLWLTHIDADGNDSPPVLLEHATLEGRAANIPEFINIPPDMRFQMVESFVTDYNFRRQGDATVKAGDLELATKYYREAIVLNPDNQGARVHLATALWQLGREREAERHFKIALQGLDASAKDKESCDMRVLGHCNLALMYCREKRFEEAAGQFRIALSYDPTNEIAHRNLGMIYAQSGNVSFAEEHFRAAVAAQPKRCANRVWLAKILDYSGRKNAADAEFSKALQCTPLDEDECLFLAGELSQRPGYRKNVEEFLRHYLEFDPTAKVGVNLMLGKICFNHNDLQGAETAFKAAKAAGARQKWLDEALENIRRRQETGR